MLENKCPDKDELIAFFIDGNSGEKSDGLEAHLVECEGCRTMLSTEFLDFEIDAAQVPESLLNKVKNLPETKDETAGRIEIVDNEDSTGWFSVRFLKIALASVLVLFTGYFGMTYLLSTTTLPTGDGLREASSDKKAILLLLPENDVVVEGEKVDFSWSPIDDEATYALVLSDEKGDIVKEIKTESPAETYSANLVGDATWLVTVSSRTRMP